MAADPPPPTSPHPDAAIRLHDVTLRYGGRPVLSRLCCHVPRGGITVVVGGSGVGKSTLLKLIGGLLRTEQGVVDVAGVDMSHARTAAVRRARHRLGMMFQGGALLDSLTVMDNVAFPLREHTRLSPVAIEDEVHAALERVGLSGVDELLPGQLSGGMVKRVALARAMIMRPTILLCDEPFSGLDPISARRIEQLLQRINEELGMTIVVVSHDAPSTRRLAHHVLALLPDAAVEGPVEALVRHEDPRVAALLDEEIDASRLAGTSGSEVVPA